jgi:predicted dehydrogenase
MSEEVSRRAFFQKSGAAAMAVAAAGVAGSATAADENKEMKSGKPVRVGVIGLGRGLWLIEHLLTYHPGATVTAVCDLQEDRVRAAIGIVKRLRGTAPAGYSKGELDYRNLCARGDVDGVLIVTPVYWLGRMTVDALKAGKHAAHEVSGAQTEEECWDMVREKEKSGKKVMILEQCCFSDENLAIYNMIRQGLFGETYYSECSYVHDCRDLAFLGGGKLTWRGDMMRDTYGTVYPQHGLAIACKWLGINDGDRMEYCQTMMTAPRETHEYAIAKFGPDSPEAKVDFKCGDFASSLISTAKGKMIRVDYSITNTRPYNRYYLVQGTKGCWDSRSGPNAQGGMFVKSVGDDWLSKYRHAYRRKDGRRALGSGGHGGLEYFCIGQFVDMIREGKEPWNDVYDTAAMSSVIFCSRLSLDRKGARVEMPDFTGGRWKDPNWRSGRMSVG